MKSLPLFEKAPQISYIVLTSRGCQVCNSSFQRNVTSDQLEFQFSCSHSQEIDGVKFQASIEEVLAAEVDFELRGHDTVTNTWTLIAASSYRMVPEGIRFLPRKPVPLSMGGIEIDFRPSWPLIIDGSVTRILYGSMLIFISILSITGKVELTKSCMTSMYLIICLHRIVIPPGYFLIGEPLDAFVPTVKLLVECAFFLALLRGPQRWLPPAMVAYGTLRILAKVVGDCWLYDDSAYLYAGPDVLSPLFLLGGLLVMFLSRNTVQRSIRLVRPDITDYGRAWRPLCDTPVKRKRLADLHAAVEAIARRCPRGACRHLEGSRVADSAAAPSAEPGTCRPE